MREYLWCRWWRRIQRARNGDTDENKYYRQAQFYRFDEPYIAEGKPGNP